MKAAVVTGPGDVSKLEIREVPEPTVGPEDVKVRVKATSINPIDWKIRAHGSPPWMNVTYPFVLGRDAAGEVVDVGAQVKGFARGQRVMGLLMHAYAELAVAPAMAWAPVPEGLDLVDAAALPLVTLTGAQLIEDGVAPQRGEVLLVTGALGSVGRVAVFVARAAGVKVLAGVRKRQLPEAQTLGAERAVALDDPADVDRLPMLDAIADTVGGDVIARLLPHVKKGGAVGSVLGEPPGAKDRGLRVRAVLAHPDAKRLGELARAVAARELVVPIAKRFPLSDVREAHRFAESGAGGKVLLVP